MTPLLQDGGKVLVKNTEAWEFSGGPVVRTQRFHCQGPGSIPGRVTKTPQATWLGQNK